MTEETGRVWVIGLERKVLKIEINVLFLLWQRRICAPT
jgi:hypothetical protein